MSIINRNNYEIYFLDYLEGNLIPELKKEMDLFLINNPDLKDELDGLDDAVLPDEKIVFPAKQSLKNIPSSLRPERFDTDDEFLVAKIEGDLTPREEIIFESYVKANPLLEKEYSLYKLTKLQPDEAIVFEYKESLKLHEVISDKMITERPARFSSDDEFLVAKLEGDLTPREEIVFGFYLKENPSINKEYSLFKLTKLEPDQSIVFDNKSFLKRLEIPSRYHILRNYSYAVASVAAILIFIAFFFFEKEETPVTPGNPNYLSPVHRTSENQGNDIPENNISFTGTPKTNEKENNVINMEIKIQKDLHTNLNNNTAANDESSKKNDLSNPNKIVIDENFNPDNLMNVQKPDQNIINKAQDKVVQNNNEAPKNQQVNQTAPKQQVKKNNNNDNSNLTLFKVVSMSIRGLSNLTGNKMELKQQYDANGNVKSMAFNSSKLEISAPVKKK